MTTKRNLLLVSLLLVFGLGVMAPSVLAQTETVVTVTQNLYTLRMNSTGDAVGQTILNFTSGGGVIPGKQVFRITYNAVSYPAGAQPQILGASAIGSAPVADFCNDSAAVGIAGEFCSAMTVSAPSNGVYGHNVLELTMNDTGASGPWTSGYIVIGGIRFDATGWSALTYITATVDTLLSQNVGVVFNSLGSQAATAVNVGFVQKNALVLTNLGASSGGAPGTILSCQVAAGSIRVNVAENWSGAWTSYSDEVTLAPYLATNGSDVSIEVDGIPAGVTVTPGTITPYLGVTFGALPSAYACASGPCKHVFDYPLTSTTRNTIQSADFPFTVTSTGATQTVSVPMSVKLFLDPTTLPENPPTPAFTYSSALNNKDGEPAALTACVYFIPCKTSLLYPYVTNYIGGGTNAFANWDTALEVANTTSDPFASIITCPLPFCPVTVTGSASPQNGSCTFYFYNAGTLPGSETASLPVEATPISWTTPVVASGGTYSFMLSQVAEGLTGGYAIAVCDFTNAVGLAETMDNAGIGAPQAVAAYLPYVIPSPYLFSRISADYGLGEFAIHTVPAYGSPWPF